MSTKTRYENLVNDNCKDINTYYDLFYEDSLNDCELIDLYYKFVFSFDKNAKCPVNQRAAVIAKNYYNADVNYEKAYQFTYLDLFYCYSVGDYSEALFLISRLNNKQTPPDYLLSAYIIQLNILLFLNMIEDSVQCIEYVYNADFFNIASEGVKDVFYINASRIYAMYNDASQSEFFYTLLIKNVKNDKHTTKSIVIEATRFFADVILTNMGTYKLDLEQLSKEFFDFIFSPTNVSESEESNIIFEDSNTYISILKILGKYYTDETKYNLCKYIIDHSMVTNMDLVNYLNYFREDNNAVYVNNIRLLNKHIEILNETYSETRSKLSYTLREKVRLTLIEERLKVLEEKYNYDSLTNCYNRNHFQEIDNTIISKGCIVYFDLDDLKNLNDKYGHEYGDEYLKLFVQMLLNVYKTSNHEVYRNGGDEFVIVSYDETRANCLKKIDHLRKLSSNISLPGTNLKAINYSCGIEIITKETTIKEATILADKAMYDCKTKRKAKENCAYVINGEE